ncbi:hypothetical protein [Halalkalibacter alkalisediminis]|uniref:Uncharacterized protein n=1 Tax=Halalkalibacter alkalisediminis TaxID=935616 RepID=A0ABV6NGY6_9BACI|nr:hypothetical protein [Halalkalibacter alkalisediminis]
MDLETVIEELYNIPDLILIEEEKYYNAKNYLDELKLELHFRKCDLYLQGFEGRNQEERDALKFPHLKELLAEITMAECELNSQSIRYNYLKRKMESLSVIAEHFKDK